MNPKMMIIVFLAIGSVIGFLIPWEISLIGIVPAYLFWQVIKRRIPKTFSTKRFMVFTLSFITWLLVVKILFRLFSAS